MSIEDLEKQKKTFRTIFFSALGVYIVSMALPSYDGGGGTLQLGLMFGIQCLIMSLLFCIASPIIFVGAMANVILISFYIMLGIRTGKGDYKAIDIILAVITGISAWIWLTFGMDSSGTLLIGYYVWALAVTTMAVSFVLIMMNRRQLYLKTEDNKEFDDLDALILED